ncbi:MAG: DUF763 domain-containing protein [Methanobacteriota archaeon]
MTELPLHYGTCPAWLFKIMVKLSGAISETIILEHGTAEFLRRIADPFFFQSLGCVVGFDFHSSGLTTTLAGALKEALEPEKLGVAVCGGKGKVSKQTPDEIERLADVFSFGSRKLDELKYASRMVAKVDNACVQDGYQLYHHTFILNEDGDWAVVQQGMHDRLARRYHWLSEGAGNFVEEPHAGIVGEHRAEATLDMTARESDEARRASVDLVCDNPKSLMLSAREAEQRSQDEYFGGGPQMMKLVMQKQHNITKLSKQTVAALQRAYEFQPENYEELVAIRGIGPRAVRALALVSDLIYGEPPSWKDPVRFSFAHGGKDGVPYPVDRHTYQNTIDILRNVLEEAKIERREKMIALRRLHDFVG